jgi:hypothetical protein
LRALDRVNVSVSIDGREGRTLVAHVGDFGVSFTIDRTASRIRSQSLRDPSRGSMRCELMDLCGGDKAIDSWSDIEGTPLEERLADIAVAIVVHGERVCRSSAQHHREWVIKRKAEIVDEQRRKEDERRRLEREHLERLERARVARLLTQARALRDAQEIRAYVAAVRQLQPSLESPLSDAELEAWAAWALSQADQIDPVRTGAYKAVPADD